MFLLAGVVGKPESRRLLNRIIRCITKQELSRCLVEQVDFVIDDDDKETAKISKVGPNSALWDDSVCYRDVGSFVVEVFECQSYRHLRKR